MYAADERRIEEPEQRVRLAESPLCAADVEALVRDPAFGAAVTFAGVVRAFSRERRILYLEYEAYRPLAIKRIEELIAEAEVRWRVRCAIAHRLGRIEIGEASVIVAVGAVHRAEAFESCGWLMDSLKDTVPIWKKEFAEDGAYWVEGPSTAPSL